MIRKLNSIKDIKYTEKKRETNVNVSHNIMKTTMYKQLCIWSVQIWRETKWSKLTSQLNKRVCNAIFDFYLDS